MDRAFENQLKDFTDENYLDNNNKLENEYSKLGWNFINYAIKRLNEYIEDSSIYSDITVYTGASGIALTYLKYYEKTHDDNYLNKSNLLIKQSLKHAENDSISFLCGEIGPLVISAYIHKITKHEEKSKECIHKVLEKSSVAIEDDVNTSDEFLYGRAGYLYSLLFIRKYISKESIHDSLIIEIFHKIINSGKDISKDDPQYNSNPPLMYEWHEKNYIGSAHGLSGVLYILLKTIDEIPNIPDLNSTLSSFIIPTIDYLITCKYESGNFKSSTNSTTDKLVQWCHGSAGIEYVLNLAFKITNNPLYLQEALKCGEVTWNRGLLKKGYGICHGVAGNAYTFLDLFKLTKDPKWMHRAWMFAKWCFDYDKRTTSKPDRPYSLFEGLSGTIYLILDMLDPLEAKFPGFQI